MSNFLQIDSEIADKVMDAEDLKPAPAGEYTLELIGCRTNEHGSFVLSNNSGDPYIMPEFEIVEHPEADSFKPINQYIGIPHKGLSPKRLKMTMAEFRRFCESYRLDPTNEIDLNDSIGFRANAILAYEEDKGFGEQNRVKRFLGAA